MPNAVPVIVVVDGSNTIRTMFQRSVEELNVRLETFESAAESMRYLDHEKPDLLFIDIFIKDKDGLTFLEELRENPLHQDTPVVVISSKDYAQDRGQAKKLGALEYMTKPMQVRAIREVIKQHIQV
jgi:CheY-like chemotaxis protein